jgi:hypothetical protein
MLFERTGMFCAGVDIRLSFGEYNEICLDDTPLLVTLSIHVTLCTVLMAFLL